MTHQPSSQLFHPAMPAEAGVPGHGTKTTIADDLSDNDWKRGMSPEVLAEIEAENARMSRQGTISVAVLVFASLVAGAAVCFQVTRYGGHEHWVMKRSVAAWLVGMMTAGAMLASSANRGGALRLLAAVTAAAAILGGKFLTAASTPYAPMDVLLIVLAVAGSTFTFLLAEPSKPKPSETAHSAAPSTT